MQDGTPMPPCSLPAVLGTGSLSATASSDRLRQAAIGCYFFHVGGTAEGADRKTSLFVMRTRVSLFCRSSRPLFSTARQSDFYIPKHGHELSEACDGLASQGFPTTPRHPQASQGFPLLPPCRGSFSTSALCGDLCNAKGRLRRVGYGSAWKKRKPA